MPLERDGTHLEGDRVTLKRNSTPSERDGVPLKSDSMPLESDSMSLERESGSSERDGTPSESDSASLKSDSAPSKRHQKGTAHRRKEIVYLNMLIKRQTTYLLLQEFLCDIKLQLFTKDTRPEILDKIHIVQANFPPGIILGHAKLGPVWKQDGSELQVEKLGSFTRQLPVMRSLDVILSRHLCEPEIERNACQTDLGRFPGIQTLDRTHESRCLLERLVFVL